MGADLPEALPGRTSRLSWVWIVPLIAFAAGALLFYREFVAAGPRITIRFHDGTGLDRETTVIRYQGVACGRVRAIQFSDDLKEIIVKAELAASAEGLARAGSRFWIVRPQIGIGGVRGLETITRGAYIQVLPGHGRKRTDFKGLEQAPEVLPSVPGIEVRLRARTLGGVRAGASVTYRDVPVGTVKLCELEGDDGSVRIVLHIDERYARLVRSNTRFWRSGGLDMHLGLLGTEIHARSLESIFANAIAFATPDEQGGVVGKEATFDLLDEPPKDWQKWQPHLAAAR